MFSLNSSTYGKLAAQIGTLAVQDLVAASGDRLIEPRPWPLARPGDDRDRRVLGARERSRGRAARARTRVGHAACSSPRRSSPTSTGPRPGCAIRCSASPRSRSPTARTCPSSAQTIAQMAGTEKVWEETRQIGGGLLGGSGSGSRHAPAGRAVHRPSERDQGAADRRGGRDLEDPAGRPRDRADRSRRRARNRRPSWDADRYGAERRADHAHEPERRRRRAPRSSAARRRRRTRRRPRRPRASRSRASPAPAPRRSSRRGRGRGARARSGRPPEPRSSASGTGSRPRPRRSARACARRRATDRRRPAARRPPTPAAAARPAMDHAHGARRPGSTPRPASPGRRRTPRRCCAAG